MKHIKHFLKHKTGFLHPVYTEREESFSNQHIRFCRPKIGSIFSCMQTDGKEGIICLYEVDKQHCKKTACCLEMEQ